MSTTNVPRGPGLFEITHANGTRVVTNVRRLAGAERAPGSALIAVAAWLLALIGAGALYVSFAAQYTYIFTVRHQDAASVVEALLLDVLMIVFTLLALGLSRAGKSSRTERALILACAAASAWMNVSAADTASPRSVVAYAVAPVALAVVVDRVVAVIRRHVLAVDEASAWTVLGRGVAAAVRLAGLVLLYSLRTVLAPRETSAGLRRMVLDAAPVPEVVRVPPPAAERPERQCWCTNPLPCLVHGTVVPELPPTKKAALLALYRAHPDYGDRASAARVAAELAPQAGLQANTARAYLYAELESRAS